MHSFIVFQQLHDDKITKENQAFIKEAVHSQFGPPVVIKGTETYQNPVSESLLKGQFESVESKWGPYEKRCGAIARKIGVVPLWKKNGEKVSSTMLQVNEIRMQIMWYQ